MGYNKNIISVLLPALKKLLWKASFSVTQEIFIVSKERNQKYAKI